MTDHGQQDSVGGGCVPDELVLSAIKRAEAIGCFQGNPKAPFNDHLGVMWGPCGVRLATGSLWVIEAPILAVGRFSWFAAAEVSGGYRFSIAFMSQQLDKPRLVLNLFVQDAGSEVVGSWIFAKGHVA